MTPCAIKHINQKLMVGVLQFTKYRRFGIVGVVGSHLKASWDLDSKTSKNIGLLSVSCEP